MTEHFEKSTVTLTFTCKKCHYFYSCPRGLYKLLDLKRKYQSIYSCRQSIYKLSKLKKEIPKYLSSSFKIKITNNEYAGPWFFVRFVTFFIA